MKPTLLIIPALLLVSSFAWAQADLNTLDRANQIEFGPQAIAPAKKPAPSALIVSPAHSSEDVNVVETPVTAGAESGSERGELTSALPLSTRTNEPHSIHVTPMIGYGAGFAENVGRNDGSEYVAPRGAFRGGVLVELGRGDVTFETGALYLRESFSYDISETVGATTTRVAGGERLDYVGVPLTARANLRTEEASAYVRAGVIPAALGSVDRNSRTSVSTAGALSSQSVAETRATQGFKDVVVFGTIGAGLLIPMSESFDLRIDAAYNRSLGSINDGGNNITASSISGLIGVSIGL